MTYKELEILGWKCTDNWNNRDLFTLVDGKLDGFSLFEHNGDFGIMDPYRKDFSLIYCNMTDDEIKEFTNIIKTFEEIFNYPKDHSFFEYLCIEKDSKDFVKKMKDKT